MEGSQKDRESRGESGSYGSSPGGTPWWLRRGWWQPSQRNDWTVWEVENTELTCQQTGS